MLLAAGQLGVAACSNQKVVLGTQCPAPSNPRAQVRTGMDAGVSTPIYGTSCAPCDSAKPEYDASGCPIFVTFDSCGGDICIGNTRVVRLVPDAGTADGGDDDGGGALSIQEDAGGL